NGDPIEFFLDAGGKITGTADINESGKAKVAGELKLSDPKSGKVTGRLVFGDRNDVSFKIVDMKCTPSGRAGALQIKGKTAMDFVLDVSQLGAPKAKPPREKMPDRPDTASGPPAKRDGPAMELARDLAKPVAIEAAGKRMNVDIGHAAPCV